MVWKPVALLSACVLLSLAFLTACEDMEEQRGAPGEETPTEETDEGDDQGAARTDEEQVEPEGQTSGEGEDEDGPARVSSTLEVTLVDYEIQMTDTAEAGVVVLSASNESESEHGVAVVPANGGDDVESLGEQTAEPGESVQLEVELEPGEYIVYCPVGDHREEHGMETELTVE